MADTRTALAAPGDTLSAGDPDDLFTITDYVASDTALITTIRFLPDGRMLIGEKTGALKIREANGTIRTLYTFPVTTTSEQGLLGVAVQLLRRRRRTFGRLRSMLESFGSAPTVPTRTPEDATSQGEESARLHAAMARLSEDKRLVLVMVEWNGMSGVEVAKILGIPVGTVWRRLHEARAEIRRMLERGAR